MGVEYRDGQNYPETYEDYVPPGTVARCMLEMMQYVYPVGSIYLSLNEDFDPNQAFGGTWTLITNGKFLESTNINPGTEIAAGLPNITGTAKINSPASMAGQGWVGALNGVIAQTTNKYAYQTGTYYGGNVEMDASRANAIYGNSNTVQPPAITCFMWKRTA